MAGNVTKDRTDHVRSMRARPHWWAVLAVSLALLALVAAATTGNQSPTVSRHATRAPIAPRPQGESRTPVTTSATTTTTPTTPEPSRSTVTPATSTTLATTQLAAAEAPHFLTGESSPSPTTTTTTTAPAPPAAPSESYSDFLQYPDDYSASYSFTGSGSMQVSASWTPTTTSLSLDVTCPDDSESDDGTSPVAVVLANANGPCEAILKETLVQYAAVSYTLTIGPTPGG